MRYLPHSRRKNSTAHAFTPQHTHTHTLEDGRTDGTQPKQQPTFAPLSIQHKQHPSFSPATAMNALLHLLCSLHQPTLILSLTSRADWVTPCHRRTKLCLPVRQPTHDACELPERQQLQLHIIFHLPTFLLPFTHAAANSIAYSLSFLPVCPCARGLRERTVRAR